MSPVADGLTAAEPSPHSAGEPDKAADDKKDADAPPFHFPDDAGGALLAKVLPPADAKGPLDEPNAGPRSPAPGALDARPPSLPPTAAGAAAGPRRTRPQDARARTSSIDETLGLGRGDPLPPQPRSFHASDRVRLPSVDVNQPPPLPILATSRRRIVRRWTTRPRTPPPRRRWRRRCRSARTRPRISA